MSNKLLDTLTMTLSDAMYGKPPGYEPIVLLHPVLHRLVGEQLRDMPAGSIFITHSPNGRIALSCDGRTVHLMRSQDMPEDKVYVFFEAHVTTIHHQKPNDGTQTNTLP